MDVLEVWPGMCEKAFWGFWRHDPNKMTDVCYDFIGEHEDDIIDGYVARRPDEDSEQTICNEITKACVFEKDHILGYKNRPRKTETSTNIETIGRLIVTSDL